MIKIDSTVKRINRVLKKISYFLIGSLGIKAITVVFISFILSVNGFSQNPNNVAMPKPTLQGIDTRGFRLTFSDEFAQVSWTNKSPKGNYNWYCQPAYSDKWIGFSARSAESLIISNGVLINKLWFKANTDKAGNYCGGIVGMKDSSGNALVNVQTPGAKIKNRNGLIWGNAGFVGMKFTPSRNLVVSQLGRYNIAGSLGAYDVRIFDAATGNDVAKAIVNLKNQPDGWVYAPLEGGASVTLQAGRSYYLVSATLGWNKEKNNYATDYWYDGGSTVIAADGIKIQESVWGVWNSGSLFSVDTKGEGFTQKYGYWEARVKMPASGTGAWPSFCLYSIPGAKLSEEVDIFEGYGNNYPNGRKYFGMRNHNWGNGPKEGSADVWPEVSAPWANWHIYGFLAMPAFCAFYVDGVQYAKYLTPNSYMINPSYMSIEYNIGGWWPLHGLVANSHLDVDWIRVWSLPEELLKPASSQK
ncbi:MAG: glycoside hydrolase family 16 protein [Verrucomicrobiia bacterium]